MTDLPHLLPSQPGPPSQNHPLPSQPGIPTTLGNPLVLPGALGGEPLTGRGLEAGHEVSGPGSGFWRCTHSSSGGYLELQLWSLCWWEVSRRDPAHLHPTTS